MDEIAFEILERFVNGEKMSRSVVEERFKGKYKQHLISDEMGDLVKKKFIESTQPECTNVNSPYTISQQGNEAYTTIIERNKNAPSFYAEELRIENLQKQLLELSIQTGQSSLITDASLQKTNDSIRDLNRSLKNTNRWTIIIAAITGIFIAFTFFKDDAKDLRLMNKQLIQQNQLLDSIAQYQKGVRSSLEKAIKDSFYQVRH